MTKGYYLRNKSYLVIATLFVIIVIGNKVGVLNKRIEEYQNKEQKQIERIEQLKSENNNIQEELEAEKKRADARVADRLAKAKQTPKKVSVIDTGACITAMKSVFPEPLWNGAQKVLSHENGSLNPNAIGGPNKNGSYDYGCFQINGEKEALDPVVSATRAYDKYKGGRVGANNWSAWYAVCTPGNNPQPKYAGVRCNG